MPNNEIKMVAGNFKAKIGQEDIYKGVIGKHSIHLQTDNNGQKVTDLAISKSMIISSTCFPTRTSIK
jgi:putative aminopeptidase FrvX